MQKPTFSPSFWQQLALHNPIGMRLTEDDARAWFDFVWLKYSTHHYKKHRRAIINWWSRVREEDILAARERVARMTSDFENAALEEQAQRSAEEAKIIRVDFFQQMRADG